MGRYLSSLRTCPFGFDTPQLAAASLGVRGICSPAYAKISKRNLRSLAACCGVLHLSNYYGSRPPRVGDMFIYSGVWSDGTIWYVFFRIDRVSGNNVAGWQALRGRGLWR